MNSAVTPSVGRTTQANYVNSPIPILPVPESSFTLFNTSDVLTLDNKVSVGEIVTFFVNISLPEGTMSALNVTVRVPSAAGLGELSILRADVDSFPANFEPSGAYFNLRDVNADGVNDTMEYGFSTLVNNPDNQAFNDIFTLYITTLVTNSPYNVERLWIDTTSVLAYTNTDGRHEITNVVPIQMVSPVLKWNVTWNATEGDAGDEIECTVVITHDTVCDIFFFSI